MESVRSPDANENYVALVSYLPQKSVWHIFPAFIYAPQVMAQLKKAQGLSGYTLLTHPFEGKFWTHSAWKK